MALLDLLSKLAERLFGESHYQITNPNLQAQPRQPLLQPSPSPIVQSKISPKSISSGLERGGFANAPIATLSSELAQAGEQLPETIDPYLPTIIALMESRGLQDLIPAQNANPYNIMVGGKAVQYPDPQTAILGRGTRKGGTENQFGLLGLLRPGSEGGMYQDFRESGDLADFFSRFTPESDPNNPSTEELVRRYQVLRQLFE